MQAHRIQLYNIYNINKKNFLIGIYNSKYRIAFKTIFANEKLLDIY